MKSYLTMRKIILLAIVLLIGCDISLLFAAQDPVTDIDSNGQQLQQIQQLQTLPNLANRKNLAMASDSMRLNSNSLAANSVAPSPLSNIGNNNNANPMPDTSMQASGATLSNNNMLPATSPSQTALSPSVPPSSNTSTTLSAALSAPSDSNNNMSLLAQTLPPPAPEDQIREDAFTGMTRAALPMTPDQIMRLKRMFSDSQQAAAATPGTPPRPTATSLIVSLAPGATPPVIRLAQGFVSSLVFLDSSGAPWPIDAYDIGNPSAFNIQWNKSDSTLLVQANSMYNYGNLAVKLKGLVTPVMITLIPGQQAVDYRVDLRIQGLGPNALPLPGDGLPNSADPQLLGVLDGIPPAGSKLLNVIGGEGQAWLVSDKVYLRTRLTVLSPSWLATMSSADGMKAYLMQKTPMLLVSQHGKPIQLKIEGL
jgi:intracellular multiplication protein IcmK